MKQKEHLVFFVSMALLACLSQNSSTAFSETETSKPLKNRLNDLTFLPGSSGIIGGDKATRVGNRYMSGSIRHWSLHDGKLIDAIKLEPPEDFEFPESEDERFLATFKYPFVKVWDYSTGKLANEFDVEFGYGYAICDDEYPMAFSSDSKYFALEINGQLCLYDTAT